MFPFGIHWKYKVPEYLITKIEKGKGERKERPSACLAVAIGDLPHLQNQSLSLSPHIAPLSPIVSSNGNRIIFSLNRPESALAKAKFSVCPAPSLSSFQPTLWILINHDKTVNCAISCISKEKRLKLANTLQVFYCRLLQLRKIPLVILVYNFSLNTEFYFLRTGNLFWKWVTFKGAFQISEGHLRPKCNSLSLSSWHRLLNYSFQFEIIFLLFLQELPSKSTAIPLPIGRLMPVHIPRPIYLPRQVLFFQCPSHPLPFS